MMTVAAGPSMEPTMLRGAALQPEKRLLLAVLEDAVTDFKAYATLPSGRGRAIFVEAEAWFESPAADRAFDFESICQSVDLDPSFIRGGLERWCAARRRSERSANSLPVLPCERTRHAIAVVS